MTTPLTPDAERLIALANAVVPDIQPWQETALAAMAEGSFPYVVMSGREAARHHRQTLDLLRRVAGQPLTDDETHAVRAIVEGQPHAHLINTELLIGSICNPAPAEGDPESPIPTKEEAR